MPEPVRVLVGDQQLTVDRLADRGNQPLLGQLRGGGQQLMFGRSSHRGSHAKDLPCVSCECCEPGQEHALQSSRKRPAGLAAGFGREQLLG